MTSRESPKPPRPAAVEIRPLDAVGAAVGPVELARRNVEGQAPGGAQAGGDEILDFRAVEVGALDAVGAAVGPVELARGRIQGQPPGDLQAGSDQILDPAAVEVGPLDLVAAAVGPVELARGRVQGQPQRRLQAGHQILDLRAVEVCPLDPVAAVVAPVDLTGGRVQGQTQRDPQSRGHQVLDPGAVEVGALDLVAAVVGPIELAGRFVHGQAARVDQAAVDHVLHSGAVQAGALNAVRVRVRPVEHRDLGTGSHRRADPFRKRRVGRVGVVGLDEPGVGQVDLPVPVDVPQGDVAGGKGQGRVLAVRGDQQGVGEIDLAVAVDVAQQTAAGQRLSPGQTGEGLDLDLNRPGPHPEGRVDIGDQFRTPDRQPVDRPLAAGRSPRPAGAPPPSTRRDHRAVEQHHRPRQALLAPKKPVQIHPRSHPPPGGVGRVPGCGVKAGRPLPVHQGRHPLPQDVEHLQPHLRCRRQLIRDDRRGVERVGVVLAQVQARRKGCGLSQGVQRQREVPALIGGGAQRAPQLGEQPHPRPGAAGAPEDRSTRPSSSGSAPAADPGPVRQPSTASSHPKPPAPGQEAQERRAARVGEVSMGFSSRKVGRMQDRGCRSRGRNAGALRVWILYGDAKTVPSSNKWS